MAIDYSVDKLITIAEAEVGYREKRTNSQLDDKTGNAGSGNYTKYNRDLKAWTGTGSLNAQWCQAFVDWCFIKAFGVEGAKKLIYTWTNYTPTGSDAFKKRGRYIRRGQGAPERGDVIYFYSTSKGRIGHVGIVYKVGSGKVYTIEGNASDGVNRKSYNLSNSYIDGYGRVDYAALDDETEPEAPQAPVPDEDTEAPAPDEDTELPTLSGDDGWPELEITGSVNIRKGPGVEYERVAIAHKGDRLPWLGWYPVIMDGQVAWVSARYAEPGE